MIERNKLKFDTDIKKAGAIAYSGFYDTLEGATLGKFGRGHGGGEYWRLRTNRITGIEEALGTETFAHFVESSIANEDSLKLLRTYLPTASKIFDEMID